VYDLVSRVLFLRPSRLLASAHTAVLRWARIVKTENTAKWRLLGVLRCARPAPTQIDRQKKRSKTYPLLRMIRALK
jgi:hypothetical protein